MSGTKSYTDIQPYSEIQHYLDWAIKSRRTVVEKNLQKWKTKINENQSNEEKLVEEISSFSKEHEILKSTSTCKEEVEGDAEYMSTYYPFVDQIYDKGGLTLVSKCFMKWAKALVIEINAHINIDQI